MRKVYERTGLFGLNSQFTHLLAIHICQVSWILLPISLSIMYPSIKLLWRQIGLDPKSPLKSKFSIIMCTISYITILTLSSFIYRNGKHDINLLKLWKLHRKYVQMFYHKIKFTRKSNHLFFLRPVLASPFLPLQHKPGSPLASQPREAHSHQCYARTKWEHAYILHGIFFRWQRPCRFVFIFFFLFLPLPNLTKQT